jgi:peptidoglycan/LPS O-acetylase OafA/YrhL
MQPAVPERGQGEAPTPAPPAVTSAPTADANPDANPDARAPAPTSTRRLRELDLLRFVAAIAVVLFHYTARSNPAWSDQNPIEVFPALSSVTRYGSLGVELFFMISGFVILMTIWKRGVGEFAIARITRLFPAYVFAVLFTSAVIWLFSGLDYDVTPLQVLTNLTMLQSGLGVPDVDGVYWSLFVELRFYLLIAVLIVVGVTYRSVVTFMFLWVVVTVIARAVPIALLDYVAIPRWSHYFIAGMALYLIHRFGSNLLLWSFVFVSYVMAMTRIDAEVIGATTIVDGNVTATGMAIGTTAIFVLMGLVALGALRWMTNWRWLTALGLLTYPLYLLHEWIGWILIDRLYPDLSRVPTLLVTVLVLIALSYAVARFVEAPLSARTRTSLNRTLEQMRTAEPSAAAASSQAAGPDGPSRR